MLRIISDVHGEFNRYKKLLPQKDEDFWTIQLGDMGFDYSALLDVKCERNKFFGGNHDNYDTIDNVKHNIGNYGQYSLGGETFFFVRGAHSIDKNYRVNYENQTGIKIWWKEEELSISHKNIILNLYQQAKPYLVITHDCPQEISKLVGNPKILTGFGYNEDFCSTTQDILQGMFNIHKPDIWFFGHFHRRWNKNIKGTDFYCLNELQYLDIENGKIIKRELCHTNSKMFLNV